MKTKKIIILFSLVFLFILAANTKSNAQCSYVTTGTSNDTTITIPCSFPVFEETGSQVVYTSDVMVWDTTHQSVKVSKMLPLMADGKAYIEIPESDYKKYSTARQNAINSKSYYKVKK